MSTMPFLSPTTLRADAWEREMLRSLVLADRLGVHLSPSVLAEYDVRDLQRLQWALKTADEKPGWWHRIRGRWSQSPARGLFFRAVATGSRPA